MGQGIVTLFPCLPLKNVLQVPKLSVNLLSVHQVTKDLDCRSIQPTVFFRIGLWEGCLDMLRKIIDSISLRQRVEVATNLHIPIYLMIFP